MRKEVAALIILFIAIVLWCRKGTALEELVNRYCNVDIFPVTIHSGKQCPYGNYVMTGVDVSENKVACGRISVSCSM